MAPDEVVISRAIIERVLRKFDTSLEADVAVVGGEPAGLAAAHYLVRAGYSDGACLRRDAPLRREGSGPDRREA